MWSRNRPLLSNHKRSSHPPPLWGGFRTARAQSAHSANYYVVYPGNTPENHPPAEGCMIHSKQHRGCRIQDPGTRNKHQTKKKNSLVYQQGGGRVQNSGPWDPWLPVVENSRLFAQRAHSMGTARAQRTVRPLCPTPWGHLCTARAQRAHDRKKLGVFATIGNILAYIDHTTLPQCWTASCFTPPPPPKPPKATAHRANGHRVAEVGHKGYDYNGSSG